MSEVLVERRGAVQVITINRPEARNALNGAVAAGIRDAADELDADGELRAGVLTGAGGRFSSGMDLKAFLQGESPSFPGRGLCGITQTPPRKPLIGAAEGWALAGGFELLLACDLVVAGESARFGVPEVKRSLVAGAGGALLLAQRVPRALALELQLATKIAANGPLALVATKEIAHRGGDWTAAERWDEAARLMQPVFTSQDAQEGARAFAEKRAPVWKGK